MARKKNIEVQEEQEILTEGQNDSVIEEQEILTEGQKKKSVKVCIL